MRRFTRNLHTIRLQLKNDTDFGPPRTANVVSFCPLPNTASGEWTTETMVQSTAMRPPSDGGFVSGLVSQQVRKYVPAAGTNATENVCWNCKKSGRKNHMLCASCGYLQDVDDEINYFDLLSLPTSFTLEQQELTRRFRQLQTLVHPDKFSNKSSREQTNSADWSALINKAYKTLSAPIERGQYILKLQGEQLSQDNSTLDEEFLMNMMERNEQVEEANNSEELQQLSDVIVRELNDNTVELAEKFELNAVEDAKRLLIKMKYLLSIQKSIKSKMQSLMGN